MEASQVLRFVLSNVLQITLTLALDVLMEAQIFELDQVALVDFFHR